MSEPPNTSPPDVATGRIGSPSAGCPLIISAAGRERQVDPALLAEPRYAEQLLGELPREGQTIILDLRHLLDWEPAACWHVLHFIGQSGDQITVRATDGGEHASMFDAVLASLVGDEDLERFQRGKQAAIYSAVLCHPSALPAACGRIAKRMRELGVEGYTTASLVKEAKQLLGAADNAARDEPVATLVHDILPDAPCAPEAIVPAQWQLSIAGVYAGFGDEAELVANSPITITRRLRAIDGEEEWLEVAWLRDGRWQSEVVRRRVIADSRELLDLASSGAPVNSNNAREVVRFLADFEATNIEILPTSHIAQRLGWQGANGELGFLHGRELISPPAQAITPVGDPTVPTVPTVLTFRGADRGDEQLVDGFSSRGSLAGWQTAVEPLTYYPRVQIAVYASLATPLLLPLQTHNFVLSYAGATSCGKTTTLRLAASCWGNPDERSPAAAMTTWDSSRVFFERASEVINDHLLITDDTSRARRSEDIAQTIYDIGSGRGRGRGTVTGIREVGTFRTILLSSGEAPITSFSQDGGTRARVVELWGPPFGRTDEQTAVFVNAFNAGILEHFGHAGPAFARFVVTHRDQWPSWREMYAEARRAFQQRAGNNPVAARMADHFALLHVTASLVHQAGLLPWLHHDLISALWPELTAETGEADRAAAALRHVMSWAAAHADEFVGRARASDRAPAHGYAGRWDGGGRGHGGFGDYIGLLPHRLDEVLRGAGFDPKAIRRLWLDRGWLRTTEGRGDRLRARMPGGSGSVPADLVAITPEAVEEVLGVMEGEPLLPAAPR